jgi:hypothetical protein
MVIEFPKMANPSEGGDAKPLVPHQIGDLVWDSRVAERKKKMLTHSLRQSKVWVLFFMRKKRESMENSRGRKRKSYFGLRIPCWNVQCGIHNPKSETIPRENRSQIEYDSCFLRSRKKAEMLNIGKKGGVYD